MKAKKANKRLQKVEGLLTGILDGYSKADNRVHGLLDTAKAAVSDAMTMLKKQAKPPARATESAKQSSIASGGRQPSRVVRKADAAVTAGGRSVRKSA